MTERGRLERLRGASHDFRMGDHAAVIAALEPDADDIGPLGHTLLLASRALILEREGQPTGVTTLPTGATGLPTEAMALMKEALALGVAPPHVMQEMARFFARTEQPMLAHYAFLVAGSVTSSGLTELAAEHEPHEQGLYATWALRDSPMAQVQDLYGLAPYKSALVERLGAEGAAMVLAAMTGEPDTSVARERPLTSLLDYAHEHGQDFEEVIPAGPYTSRPPSILGRPRGWPTERVARSFFTCLLEDVVVSAKSDTLLAGGEALLDMQEVDDRLDKPELNVDPVIAAGDLDGVIVVEAAQPDEIRRVPEALWLSGIDSRAFGHWIIEFLPKVWAFMERPGFAGIAIIIDEGMPPQHEEALRFFIGPDNPLITLGRAERVRVDRLWVAPRVWWAQNVDAAGLVRLIDRTRATLEAVDTSGSPERIFLTRKPTQHRRLVNLEAIEAELERRGYLVVDFAEMAFAEQVRLIRGARHVVGLEGSALLMTMLGKPGLHIGMLDQPFVQLVGGYINNCDARGQHLTIVVGALEMLHPRFRWMSDYSIDLAELAGYLDSVDSQLKETG